MNERLIYVNHLTPPQVLPLQDMNFFISPLWKYTMCDYKLQQLFHRIITDWSFIVHRDTS